MALTHQIIFLLALAFTFLQPAAAQANSDRNPSTLEAKSGADSLDRFAGTWEGKCQDGVTFVVMALHLNGTQLEGTISRRKHERKPQRSMRVSLGAPGA
jgi:hypothetical protein